MQNAVGLAAAATVLSREKTRALLNGLCDRLREEFERNPCARCTFGGTSGGSKLVLPSWDVGIEDNREPFWNCQVHCLRMCSKGMLGDRGQIV